MVAALFKSLTFEFVAHHSKYCGPFGAIIGHGTALGFLWFLTCNPSGKRDREREREGERGRERERELNRSTNDYFNVSIKGLHRPFKDF